MAKRDLFSRRVRGMTISATKEMPLIAAKVGGCVSLGQGVPSFQTPAHIVEAVCEALRTNPAAGKYTLQPGLPALRRAIAETMERDKGVTYDPDTEITVTVGAMEGLLAAFLSLVDRGDEVILPEPTYATYIEQVELAEGKPVFVPLRKGDWGLDVAAIKRALTPKTKAVVVCSPGNPTGGVYSDNDVHALSALAAERDFILIFDETYDFMVYEGSSTVNPAQLPGIRDRVITVNSFSKKYAMTGWRVGYIAAAKPLMSELMKVHDAAAICAPTPSQMGALAALTGPTADLEWMHAALFGRRELACRHLDAMNDAFEYVRPRGAFYIMARYRFTDAPSRDLAIRLIQEARVITIPGAAFGPGGEGHLRLSFGGSETELDQAFQRIERWIKENT